MGTDVMHVISPYICSNVVGLAKLFKAMIRGEFITLFEQISEIIFNKLWLFVFMNYVILLLSTVRV